MTAQWRPLPDSLPSEVAYLATLLREFKDRAGLTLAALAEQTNVSKSSWDRYLNGQTLPPRHAVAALAQLAGEPTQRPLALWERAQAAWSVRDAKPPAADDAAVRAAAPAAPRRRVRPPTWLIVTAAVCVAVVALLLSARPMGLIGTAASPTSVWYAVGCRGAACDGQSSADNDCGGDAATFADLWIGRLSLELRISAQCEAGWARVSESVVGDEVMIIDRTGRTETAVVRDQASTGQYVDTPMVAVARHSDVRACLQPRTGVRRCTGWGVDLPILATPPGAPS